MDIPSTLKEPLKGGLGKALQELMLPGETVQASLEGLSGQGIALTEKRIIVVKAGIASGATFGHKAKGFRLEHITSVEFSCGLTEGRVQLTVAGSVEQRQGFMSKRNWLDEVAASRQAENVCQFPSSKKKLFQSLAGILQQAADEIHQAQAQASATAVAASAPSIPDQIRELATLVKEGLLTEEEYQEKRKELLARM